MFTGLHLTTEEMKKDKVQVSQYNEVQVYTVLQLVLLVKMKNIN